MTDNTKATPEKTESETKKAPVPQPTETTPTVPGEVSAMLVPESGNDPKTHG